MVRSEEQNAGRGAGAAPLADTRSGAGLTPDDVDVTVDAGLDAELGRAEARTIPPATLRTISAATAIARGTLQDTPPY